MIILVIGLVLALLYTHVAAVLFSSGVAPYCDATLEDLKTKHPFKPALALPHRPLDHHNLIASRSMVLDKNKSFPLSSITQVVNLFLDGCYPKMCGEYITSAPLTSLVKPNGGIHLIVVGTVWRRLVSKIERLCCEKFVSVLLLFRVRWNSVTLTQLDCITGSTPYGHAKVCNKAWYLDDGTVVGDTLVVGKVLELIMEDGPMYGLHLYVYKTRVFWPAEDPRSRYTGVFPSNIARPTYDPKTIGLMEVVAKIDDPQCELLLLRSCIALRSSLERIVAASGPGFGECQWRFSTLPFAFGELGIYSVGNVMNYAFLASRLRSARLHSKLL
nr:hypothetical protein [Tanacetum cinerariifolium]